MRNREARKVIAGYTSGRNPNAYGGGDGIFKVDEEEGYVLAMAILRGREMGPSVFETSDCKS